jgi:hypothetical protein
MSSSCFFWIALLCALCFLGIFRNISTGSDGYVHHEGRSALVGGGHPAVLRCLVHSRGGALELRPPQHGGERVAQGHGDLNTVCCGSLAAAFLCVTSFNAGEGKLVPRRLNFVWTSMGHRLQFAFSLTLRGDLPSTIVHGRILNPPACSSGHVALILKQGVKRRISIS